MTGYRPPAPVIWRCPDCGGGATSKYSRKTHVCPERRQSVAPGIGALKADKETRRPFTAAGKAGARAFAAGHEHGLIVRAIGDVVALCPPLIITEEQVHETVSRLRKALDDTAKWRAEENLN